jgi:uncharacterized membrane protein
VVKPTSAKRRPGEIPGPTVKVRMRKGLFISPQGNFIFWRFCMEEKKVSFSDAPLISVGTIARVGIFSALGVILGYISLFVPILGQQVKLDFSHLGTMFAAVFLGPFAGAITGGIVGIPPSLQFGNYLIAPIKLLTGLIVGLVIKKVKIPSLAIVMGFIPESLLTYLTLGVWGIPYQLPLPVVYTILVKGACEIAIIAAFVEILYRSSALKSFLGGNRV